MANYLLLPDITQDLAGLKFYCGVMDPSAQVPIINHTLLLILDSKFHDNTGGGVSIHVYKRYNNVKYQVIIEKCLFVGNVNKVGSSLVIVQPSLLPSTTVSALGVLLKDTNFTNDMTPEPYSSKIAIEGFNVVAIYGLRHLKIINCTFTMNKHTALQALDSTLYFEGNIIFSGNNGLHGGTMLLQGGSIFYLMPHTHIQITNNHARRGGDIYVEDKNYSANNSMFLSGIQSAVPYLAIDAVITLENNTADEAGSAVFSGSLDECFLQTRSHQSVFVYSLELT